MTAEPLLPPDPRPGVAVPIYYRVLPPAMSTLRAEPVLAVNDRVSLAPWERTRQSEHAEFWPLTASSILLYGLWRDFGLRALCVPLNP